MENEPINEAVEIKKLAERISILEIHNIILYCLIIVFVLIITVLLYSLYKKSVKSNSANKSDNKYELSDYLTIQLFNQHIKRFKNDLYLELNQSTKKNEQNMVNDVNAINQKPLENNEKKQELQQNNSTISEEKSFTIDLIIPPPQETKSFYMPSPSGNYFLENNASENFRPTVTLYKFYISKGNPNQASFEFHSDEMGLRNAISYPDKYLEPVCEEINSFNQNAKKIITIEKGIVQKNDNKWVVQTNNKAKIKYE